MGVIKKIFKLLQIPTYGYYDASSESNYEQNTNNMPVVVNTGHMITYKAEPNRLCIFPLDRNLPDVIDVYTDNEHNLQAMRYIKECDPH